MKVAFLGLGAIGEPMARHLARDPFELVVWNRTRAKADRVAAENSARAALTPADAARGSAVVITCLPSSREVESLLDGDTGLLAGLAVDNYLSRKQVREVTASVRSVLNTTQSSLMQGHAGAAGLNRVFDDVLEAQQAAIDRLIAEELTRAATPQGVSS